MSHISLPTESSCTFQTNFYRFDSSPSISEKIKKEYIKAEAIPIGKLLNSSDGQIIDEIHEMMKMPSQFNSKNTIPLETLKERIRNRKVDFSYMNIATIAALGTLFLGLFGLLITAISRCVAKRKAPKGGRIFELNQDLVPKNGHQRASLRSQVLLTILNRWS